MDIISLSVIGLQKDQFTERGPLLLTSFTIFTSTHNALRTKTDRLLRCRHRGTNMIPEMIMFSFNTLFCFKPVLCALKQIACHYEATMSCINLNAMKS